MLQKNLDTFIDYRYFLPLDDTLTGFMIFSEED